MDCTAVDSWLVDMDFESCLTEEANKNNTSSIETLMNIPIDDSISSLCADDFAELLLMEDYYQDNDFEQYQQPPSKLKRPNDYNNSTVDNSSPTTAADVINAVVTTSSTPIILNFEKGNSSPTSTNNKSNKKKRGGNNMVNSRDLNPDEEAFVSEVLRFQDHSSSFAKSNEDDDDDGADNNGNVKEKLTCVEVKKKNSRVRLPSQNYDHIIAERKRREQLSQKFLALSTMVPGLKKMDKTSVLSDAIKYLKQLQDKVKTLEANATKHSMESFVLVKRSRMTAAGDDGDGGRDGEMGGGCGRMSSEEKPLPEIEARLFNNQILLKIQIHKRAGVMAKLLAEVEKLRLSVASINASTFGNFAVDITIIAEMETDFNLAMSDVVGRLRVVL